MQIKRYETTHIQDATARIKKELGPDAIILSMKKLSDTPPRIEILAARDDKTEKPSLTKSRLFEKKDQQEGILSGLTAEILHIKASVEDLKQKLSHGHELTDLKETMDVLLDNLSIGYPEHLRNIYKRLINNGVSRPKAAGLINTMIREHAGSIDTLESGEIIAQRLISRSLPTTNRKEGRIKAFIGPTGIGKTTTLAKLAAHYSIEKKMKVGIITTDTYRIGATEQLKIYANIMGLPVEIAPEREIFNRSLARFEDKNMILVDTPGRNQSDNRYLVDLKNTLGSNAEYVLLLSPVGNREYLLNTASRFRVFNYDSVILTKVDECNHMGSMYDVLNEIGKPVSHVTTGQNVPNDIEKASPERLARMILTTDRIHPN